MASPQGEDAALIPPPGFSFSSLRPRRGRAGVGEAINGRTAPNSQVVFPVGSAPRTVPLSRVVRAGTVRGADPTWSSPRFVRRTAPPIAGPTVFSYRLVGTRDKELHADRSLPIGRRHPPRP